MAEIFPDEGLAHILGVWPKGTIAPQATYKLKCFSNFSATTVMGTAQGTADITQSAWTNYSAQSIGSAAWGAVSAAGGTSTITAAQQNMGTCGATGGTVNGFYITTSDDTKVICMANFDDLTAVVMQENDILKITPSIAFVG